MLKNDTLKNGTSCIGLYGSAPPSPSVRNVESRRSLFFGSSFILILLRKFKTFYHLHVCMTVLPPFNFRTLSKTILFLLALVLQAIKLCPGNTVHELQMVMKYFPVYLLQVSLKILFLGWISFYIKSKSSDVAQNILLNKQPFS